MAPGETGSDIEAQIAEFHRAARRRKAILFGISGVVLIAVGAVALLLLSMEEARPGGLREVMGSSRRWDLKVLGAAIAMVIGGLGALYNAYRIGSGQIDDVAG